MGQRHRIRGVRHDDSDGDRTINGMVLESLGPARARLDCDDGDLQPAVCVDSIHRPTQPKNGDDPCGAAVDVLVAYYIANVVLTFTGLSGRPLRAEVADLGWRADVRRWMGIVELRRQYLGSLLYVWRHLRIRYRHHLCRHHWIDGALVP